MRRLLLAATALVALLVWIVRRRHGDPMDFTTDVLDFLRTVVQPFDRGGHPDDRFP